MRSAFETNTWYCHAFCKIPKVQLVCPPDCLDGKLEEELFSMSTQAPKISTARQLALEGKKRGVTYSL